VDGVGKRIVGERSWREDKDIGGKVKILWRKDESRYGGKAKDIRGILAGR